MHEVRDRLRALDQIQAPDLRERIRGWEPRRPRIEPSLKRVGVALLALVVAAAGLAFAIRAFRAQEVAPKPATTVQNEDAPLGSLLVGVDSVDAETIVLNLGTSEVQSLPNGLVAAQLSEDGSKVLATRLQHEASGLGYALELVSVDVRTGAQTVLVQADPQGSLEHAKWSPDGQKLADTQVADRHAAASLIAQDEVPQYTLCVRTLLDGGTRCFPDAGSVYSFDWSPDSRRLLVGVPTGEPMRIVDVTTGESSVVVTADDPDVLDVMRQHTGVDVSAVQFIDPTWSPSGRYIGTIAMSGQTVPMIFSSDGTLVAWGRSNPEFRPFGWSPTRDILAYAVGINGESTPEAAVYLLDAVSGENELLLPAAGQSAPMVFDLVWSPGGRWLALGDMNVIRLIDTTGAEPPRRIDPFGGVPGAVIDWIT